MKRVLQSGLMRGHVAQNAAVALWVTLLAVLLISVVGGIQEL